MINLAAKVIFKRHQVGICPCMDRDSPITTMRGLHSSDCGSPVRLTLGFVPRARLCYGRFNVPKGTAPFARLLWGKPQVQAMNPKVAAT
jgi:hypothetical protein